MSARHLKVVEFDEQGQVIEPTCKDCLRRVDEIAGLEKVIRSQAAQIQALLRDKDAAAREHPLWPVGRALFCEWRTLCRHPRSPWTPDRFWQIERYLTNVKYGESLEARVLLCRRAIAGSAYDSFATTRRNGSRQVFNEWERTFPDKSGGFEERCCKAPRDWQPGARIDQGESWTFADVETAMRGRQR
jgi:hypothetical protein